MNMRKYASYKQAAKRIIRLMEKRAGLGSWLARKFTGPVGKEAPQTGPNGEVLKREPGYMEFKHPNTYAAGGNEATPRFWHNRIPETPWLTELNTEAAGLDDAKFRPYEGVLRWLPWTRKAVLERDRLNKLNAEGWKRRIDSGEYTPTPKSPSQIGR